MAKWHLRTAVPRSVLHLAAVVPVAPGLEVAIALMSGLDIAAAAVFANAAVPVLEPVTRLQSGLDIRMSLGVWRVAASTVWLWPALIADAA